MAEESNLNPDGTQKLTHEQKRTVLDADDVMEMVPALRGHRKLVDWAIHKLQIDRVNDVHRRFFDTPGVPFAQSPLGLRLASPRASPAWRCSTICPRVRSSP